MASRAILPLPGQRIRADFASSTAMAVVHEWIAARAGSEKVFEAFANAFPNADLIALSCAPGVDLEIGNRALRTTFLDNPLLRDRRGLTLPLMPLAWRAMGRAKYDVVISSHHAFAGSNRLADGGLHLCYVHSPARYVWTPELDSRGSSPALAAARSGLKRIDRRAARRLTSVAANSTAVADRIHRFWGREARVIHPPVDTEFFSPGVASQQMSLPEGFLLGFGRWIPYKNLDIVIKVAELVQRPAVIAGRGPEGDRLRELAAAARVPVTVIENPSQLEVRELFRLAAALIFPTDEDFGIIPVEAQACSTPVVAPARGGALETVVDGRTGALTDSLSAGALANEVDRAVGLDAGAIRQHASSFSYARFEAETRRWVAEFTDVV